MNIIKNIRSLRIIAFLLFLVPALGLIGSLLVHNFLVSFTFSHGFDYGLKNKKTGDSHKVLCSIENDYCKYNGKFFKVFKKLNQCDKYVTDIYWVNDKDEKLEIIQKDIENHSQIIFLKFEKSNKLSNTCILNSKLNYFYLIFPN